MTWSAQIDTVFYKRVSLPPIYLRSRLSCMTPKVQRRCPCKLPLLGQNLPRTAYKHCISAWKMSSFAVKLSKILAHFLRLYFPRHKLISTPFILDPWWRSTSLYPRLSNFYLTFPNTRSSVKHFSCRTIMLRNSMVVTFLTQVAFEIRPIILLMLITSLKISCSYWKGN